MLVLGQTRDLEADQIGVEDLVGGEPRRVAPGNAREPDPVGNEQVVQGRMQRAEGRSPLAQVLVLAQALAGLIERWLAQAL